MEWQWQIPPAKLSMVWEEWPVELRSLLVVVLIMPCEMYRMVISASKNIFQESLIHGGSFTFIHLRPMILLLIQAILFYTFYMAAVKMREVGLRKEKQI